jgi:hypothetical protein
MTIGKPRDKIRGAGMWRNNNRALNDDAYCTLMEDTIEQALTEHDNPVIAWTWMQCKVRQAAMSYGKARAKEKKTERDKLEDLYSAQLQ